MLNLLIHVNVNQLHEKWLLAIENHKMKIANVSNVDSIVKFEEIYHQNRDQNMDQIFL